MDAVAMIASKYQALPGRLDEATLRLWATVEARQLGRGGVSLVAMSRTTIYAGLANWIVRGLQRPRKLARDHACGPPEGRRRAAGGGRKKLTVKDARLLHDLDALVDPSSRGDQMSPLRWTCKSTTRLAEELARQGHVVSQCSICDLLAELNFNLQSPRKTREGAHRP